MGPLQESIHKLPSTPGVYRFFDIGGKLLYIGKAINLKRRVSSYFQKQHRDPRLTGLIQQIARLEFTPTDSVIEALILEANQINAAQPPFNVRQKDDKTFAVIGITRETFPRVVVTRPTTKLKVPLKYQFGPYTSADQAKLALKIIRKILPFRTDCQLSKLTRKNRTLGIGHLKSGGGEVSEMSARTNRGCLDYQIDLCPGPCAGAISSRDYQKTLRRVVLFLQGKKKLLVRELTREMKAAAKSQGFELATKLRNQLFALQHIQDVALLKTERSQSLAIPPQRDPPPIGGVASPQPLKRLEAFDISNIGPDSAVGSMVVIENGQPNTNEYRKFQIKTVVGQNDIAMMEEVLTRRFRHLEWTLPELVIVDGGEGHLRMATRVLRKFQLTIPVVAVAKGPERKKLDLYSSHPDLLRSPSPDLRPLIHLARDEAHRFAIRYHRVRRGKDFLAKSA